MFAKIKLTGGILGLALVCAVMLTTCDLTHTALGEGNAALPLIDIQPAPEAMYTYGDEDIEPLTVEASSPDGGVISYQWYAFPPELPENATDDDEEPNFEAEPVPGATGATFVPVFPSTPPESGIYSFYALVTNTNENVVGAKTASRKSDNAVIVVYNPDDAAYPSITTNPESAEYILGPSMSVRALTVEAEVDRGTLTYRWYRSPTGVNRGGLAQGMSASSDNFFTPFFSEEGTYYYYAVVINTDPSASGRKTITRPSQVAVITVVAVQTAATPVITTQPQDASYAKGTAAGSIAALTTGAEDAADGGDITWQWYKNASSSTSGATPIAGANSTTFTPTISTAAAGTEFYYAIATNTNEYAVNKTSTAMTRIVTVNVYDPDTIPVANATMTVDSSVKHQFVRGFGGMSPNWGNMPDDTVRDIELMFNPDTGLGYNMFRIMIPPDNTDIELSMYQLVNNRLSGDKDRSDFYELVKIVNKYNGYVLASPWSPPAEWKTNGSINGGGAGAAAVLLPQYYRDYAEYLKSFAQHMYIKGAPIYAISIQNEPNFNADYDGCEWTPDEMRDFFKLVGRFTEDVKGWGGGKEIETVLTMNGESANEVYINDAALNDAASRQAIDLIGRHVYGNQVTNGYQLAMQNGKEVWMTEHNVNSGQGQYAQDSTWNFVWAFMNDIDLVIRINSENAFIWWTSKRFYSMIGDGEYGTVDGAILPRGHGLSHYAKFARETTRIGLTASGTMFNGTTAINATNFNQSGFALGNTHARGTAYITEDGNTISVILFTPTSNSGSGGQNLGNVKIQLPAGFNARSAVAMRSNGEGLRSAMEGVPLAADRNSAVVSVPNNTILSVRFVKQ